MLAILAAPGLIGCSNAAPAPERTSISRSVEPVPTTAGRPVVERRELVDAVDAYLAAPTTNGALALVAEVARGASVDEAPYLVDLIRMSGSSLVWEAAITALAELRGGDPVNTGDVNGAYVELGSWALDQQPRTGAAYQRFKVALYGALDERFAPLLAQVDDPATLVGIQWGGVQVGQIRELNDPVRRPPSEITWAVPTEVVFELRVGDRTIVYPRRIIGPHELANDSAAGVDGATIPFGISYCSLCRTAVAFDRRAGGRELTFKTSGLLAGANKLMVDDQTGTLWQQATGEAVAGPLAGTRLDLLAIRAVAYSELDPAGDPRIVDLPEPFIIDPETGTFTSYPYTDTEPLPDYVAGGRLWFPVAGASDSGDPLTEVATVEAGGAALAVDVHALAPGERIELDLGTTRVRIEQGPVGPRFHDLGAADPTAEIPSGREAWFSWSARHPDTMRWPLR